ncbi:DUF4198 domain-containing protein [Thalassoroseus pseudoceratinae]|uniref:DUF4198 domain-containing protein n=1 Tax=Thalassoroseus pseudoceratinae TaxID=2713176 RepID=UPI0014243B27|nr:DUF4198 domain-containing protein [Thalassoroseus pseudoceratinae]
MKIPFHNMFPAMAVLAGLLAGCGGGDLPSLAPVAGKVTFNGKPLSGARVTFEPEEGRPSYGMTDANGEFTVEYKPDVPGAKIGSHTVRIRTGIADPDDSEAPPPQETIPARYNQNSNLKEEVKDEENTFEFTLESGGPLPTNDPDAARRGPGSDA